jgi:putative flippase GtrA
MEFAKFCGVAIGFLLGFILNSLWTFGASISFQLFRKSLSLNSGTIILNVGLNSFFVWFFGDSAQTIYIAFIATTIITTTINFIFLKLWVYREVKND